ncbi:hypothetical protein [Nannocystis sp.]|uniref:hypothetical protein n=1 Tax=Nannocystis sp. TaxID=1962667 RepID=UPI0024243823|nr:hypothetical protein [Nannocystis sp.]MBK7824791.1 hypothetical protein [Nannocystis sp.]MBK9752957.1 hypothetical protein [Nannocystis sp.]
MHARVPIAALAVVTTVAVAACRPNPGFMLTSGGDDSDASDASETISDTGDTEASTGEPLCEPVNQPGDICAPEFPLLPITKAVVNFSDRPILGADKDVCGAFSSFVVKRVDDQLQRCDDGCDLPCDATTAMNIAGLAMLTDFAELLPVPEACAILWHTSRDNPDPKPDPDDPKFDEWTPCVTSGFLLMDEADRKLRVAVAFDSETPDPFASQAKPPLAMKKDTDTVHELCTAPIGACLNGFTPQALSFTLDRCTVDTFESVTTTALRSRGSDYTLELHNAYRCIDGFESYRWWIRREF